MQCLFRNKFDNLSLFAHFSNLYDITISSLLSFTQHKKGRIKKKKRQVAISKFKLSSSISLQSYICKIFLKMTTYL